MKKLKLAVVLMFCVSIISCASHERADFEGIKYENKYLALIGTPSANPINMATANAISKEAEGRLLREKAEIALLNDYIKNPNKYNEGIALKKAGILPSQPGKYEIMTFNNSGRPLKVAVSGNTEGYLVYDKGYQSFFSETKEFVVYSYEMDNTPFKSKKFSIPSPTPEIPAYGSSKLYSAFVTITK